MLLYCSGRRPRRPGIDRNLGTPKAASTTTETTYFARGQFLLYNETIRSFVPGRFYENDARLLYMLFSGGESGISMAFTSFL